MIESSKCEICGGEITADVNFQQCPRCLLDLGRVCQTVGEADRALPEVLLRGALEPGLPDYEILEPIGRGGMGVVYRARQHSLNRIVAIKMIRVGDLASPAALARFRREAEAVAKLDHPNIVPIYEVGEHEANPFLVMRLVEGRSLAESFGDFSLWRAGEGNPGEAAKKSRASQVKITRLMESIGRAVHYAHDHGVLHRDLKPSNILLDQDGNPHLTDFGLAKLVDEESALTQTAEILGTPSYMAPEQAAGKPISRLADVYSLGAILYELLTGHPPFEGERVIDILRQVTEREPIHPKVANPVVDRDLATICLKCLEKEPERRYSSALELVQDLKKWERREPILARAAGPVLRLRRWSMRNPALATLIAGLSVGIVITLALLAQAHEEKRRKSIALAILRTETARQLQEIWGSPGPYFGIKSETLAALAGQEPAHLQPVKQRFTIAFAAEGNPLGLILGAAPLLEDMEKRLPGNLNETPIRLDLRLYKAEARAVKDLFNGDVDLLEMNVRDYFHAKTLNRGIQCLVSFISWPEAAGLRSDGTVIFTRADTGIKTMSDLRNRSFLFGTTDSSLTFWAKVYLVEAGISAKELSKYRYVDSPVDLAKHAVVLPDAPSLGNPFSDMTPVEAVVQGFYDAGVATEKRFLQVVSTEKLVLLTRFRDSGSLLVAKSELPASTARSFQLTLIDMKDLRILQTFPGNPSGFKAYADRDFSEVLQQLKSETKFDEDSLADK